ncbi:MAG: hypothetical protein KF686_08675 [Ramlibacter sp.]|nr:hypothetical protein [Ramlibacter sp.]MBX3659942.1 hypothetical protein [Ramlibacter sp.]
MQLSQTPYPPSPRMPASLRVARLMVQRSWPFPAATAHQPIQCDVMAQARRVIATSRRAYLETDSH